MPIKISFLSRTTVSKPDALRIRRALFCVALAFSLLATAAAPSLGPADSTRYLNDIKTLAAPDMEGRGAGAKGLERASKFIEHRYESGNRVERRGNEAAFNGQRALSALPCALSLLLRPDAVVKLETRDYLPPEHVEQREMFLAELVRLPRQHCQCSNQLLVGSD